MQEYPSAPLDVAKLLLAVEDAPPFSAADVLGERLASELDAREVSFLIADFSGHALIRLGHSGDSAPTRTQGDETAVRVPLLGSSPGRALASQAVVFDEAADGTRVFAHDQRRRRRDGCNWCGDASAEKPSSTSLKRSSRRPVARLSMTRPHCVSTGTVDARAIARLGPAPIDDARRPPGTAAAARVTASGGFCQCRPRRARGCRTWRVRG
jgi:hypothetical protein